VSAASAGRPDGTLGFWQAVEEGVPADGASRTVPSKRCLSNRTALVIFKLAEAAEKNWRGPDCHKPVAASHFTDGMQIIKSQAQAGAA
jgi:hypothetical protein